MMSSGGASPGSKVLSSSKLVDLEAAWKEREVEAAALKAAGHETMALALRLYSIEIRIKTIICKHLTLERLPMVCKTHKLEELLIFTGLWGELYDPGNSAIKKNWDELLIFSEKKLNDIRYLPNNTFPPDEIRKVETALDDPSNGVWTWLSRHP
jgi:hypothetical protein